MNIDDNKFIGDIIAKEEATEDNLGFVCKRINSFDCNVRLDGVNYSLGTECAVGSDGVGISA